MKVLAFVWEKQRGNVVFGALAGKAALQLSRGASSPLNPRLAYTLARLIGILEQQADFRKIHKTRGGRRVEFNSRTLLVIDEAGMMDNAHLLPATQAPAKGVRILLAGDDGQLFPVAFGKIFHDLVEGRSRVAALTKVLRQAEGSTIPFIAQQIRDGTTPTLPAWNGEDIGVFLVDSRQLDSLERTDDFMLIAARRQTVDEWNHYETTRRRNRRHADPPAWTPCHCGCG